MKIDLKTLETALVKLLADTRDMRGPVIDVPDHLYWFIQRAFLSDPGLTLGCLEDDCEQMQRVAQGERDALGRDLIWTSTVLRGRGEHVL